MKNRYSSFDITSGEEEPDPLNKILAQHTEKPGTAEEPGTKREGAVFCPYCGSETSPDYIYCKRCGKKL